MLFPCITCGKVISSAKRECPYCRCDLKEIIEHLHIKQVKNKLDAKAALRQRYKGTIFSLMLR